MFKRISIILLILFTLLCFTVGAEATLHTIKDAANTYILYEDELGADVMKIDDDDGVTITSLSTSTTYTTMTLTSTLDASSLTAGSFVTPGGIACAKQLFIGDDIDMSVSGTGVYDITLKDTVADALSIVGGSTDMVVFCTDTDAITVTPPLTVTGLITSNGGITVGASGAGFDVTFYGDTAGSNFVWDQNGDTHGSLTLGASTTGCDFRVHGDTAGNYLHWDNSGDDLLLVGTASQLHIAGTTTSTTPTTGSLKTAGGLGVAGTVNIGGTLTVSTDGAGTDVKIYGNTASYYIFFDASADTNGSLYIGADTKGLLTTLYGDTTGCGVFWDPTTNTNGTLSVGATGGSKGVDCIMYGTTSGKYWKWDRSADGTTTTGAAIIAPIAAGTFIDFQLDTEWVSGTLIDADFGAGTTLNNDAIGMELDFNGNITMTTDKDVTGHVVKLPALTQAAANTTAIKAFDLSTAGALVQNTGAGTINWTGIDLQMPNQTQTTGTVTCIGLNIVSGTYTSGTELGISVGANTAGLDVKFYANTTGNYLLWDESADDLMLVGTATQLDVAGTTDSTSVSTGAVSIDGGLGVAMDFFLGGDMSIATAKKITTVAELTLNTVDPMTIQVGGVDSLQLDEAAIAAFAGAADTAGHAVYIESEDGGADGGTGTGMAGGAISLKTGDGSASATNTAIGGAGGALSLITGIGLTGQTTGNGGVGGAIAITAGAGGASGAGAGDGGAGGTITLTAGAGGGAGGGDTGAPGKVDIVAGLLHMGVQTIAMGDVAVTLTLDPATTAGTLLTGNILYVDAESGATENLLLPLEANGSGAFLIVYNTGGESIMIQNDAAGAILTLETANTAFLVCNGTTWAGFVAVP